MRDKEDVIYDVYNREDIGKYVVIIRNGETSTGKLVKIIEDIALLNPFQRIDYSRGYPRYILYNSKRHQKMPLKDARVIPITRKDLENYIKYENTELDKKRKEEMSKKEKH